MSADQFYGGIEGGGTKFICLIGRGPEEIVEEARFPTTTPEETLEKVSEFFIPFVHSKQLKSLGLGSFGPVDVDQTSPTYGFITTTPKRNWANTDILGILKRKIGLPMAIDMDVAASALGEFRWGANRGFEPSLYLTVGTGIGGSYILDGKPLRGLVSLEMGHVYLPHDHRLDPFPGSCPYHGDCFEGLANGPAIQARFSQPAESLPDRHPYWDLEASYIAYALANYIFTFPPKRIVIGGGVMHREFLYSMIRTKLSAFLNNYLSHPSLTDSLDNYIVPPALGYKSGALGGLALAMDLVNGI